MIEYRTGKPDDLDEICNLVQAAIAHLDAMGIHQWDALYPAREDFAEDIGKRQLHVGILDGGIAVTFTVNLDCDGEYGNSLWEYPDDRYCVIHRLCVHPDVQHQGIARRSIEYAERQIRNSGFQSVRLDVFMGNPWALKLYDDLGYRKVGHADWRKGRFLILEKHLAESS